MPHYKYIALCRDVSLRRGWFCARSLVLYIPASSEDELCAAAPVQWSQWSCKFLYFCSCPVLSCISFVVLYFPMFLFITVLSCIYSFTLEVQHVFSSKRYLHQLVSVDCSWVRYAQKYIADVHNSAKCAFGLTGSLWSHGVASLPDKCQHRYF